MKALTERFAGHPGVPCRHHPTIIKPINLEATHRLNHGVRVEEMKPYTDRCPECDELMAQYGERLTRGRQAGVPRSYLVAGLEELVAEPSILTTLATYCQRPAGTLLLLGPPGAGKTHAGCAIINSQSERCLYTTQSMLLSAHRRTYRDESAPDIKLRACEAHLLVLDEVGRSVGGGDAEALLHDVFDARYAEGRPTIIISNLTRSELAKSLGPAISDRIKGSLSGRLEFTGQSFRGSEDDGMRRRLEVVAILEAIIETRKQ